MKKVLLLISFIALLATVKSQSLDDQLKQFQQNQNYQLTEIEYRYITKGLLDDVSMGKDLKQGYELRNIPNAPFANQDGLFGNSTMLVFGFYKVGATKPIALAIKFVKQGKQQNFICIPKFGTNATIVENCKNDFKRVFDNPNTLSVSLCFNSLQYIATYQ
jgi:hypothetical protein